MFRIVAIEQIQDERQFVQAFAASSDQKPTAVEGKKIAEGSMCVESDTGDAYMFNEASNSWMKV